MELHLIESDKIYKEILETPIEKRDEVFKQKLLVPFINKFKIQNISFDENIPFNVMTLMSFMHKMPKDLKEEDISSINRFDNKFWKNISDAFHHSIETFTSRGVKLPVKDYYLTALLGNPSSPMLSINENYGGDGGIPGYIFLSLVPNDYTINRMVRVSKPNRFSFFF